MAGTFTADAVYGVSVTATDKIVLFGTKAAAGTGRTDSDYVILSLSARGIVDFGFGTNGQAVADVNRSVDTARQILVQADGKIVATGYSRDGDGVVSPVVFRVHADGSPDADFGTNGVANAKVLTDIGGPADSWYGIGLTPDKKHAIVVGYKGTDATAGGNDDAAVARVII